MEGHEDFESLKKVEDVSDCIKRLATSSDPDAIEAADRLLKRIEDGDDNLDLVTKSSKTVINRGPSTGDNSSASVATSNGGGAGATPDAFLLEIERDATERATRRERNRKRAAEWKERGNAHFKLASYAKAVDCYTRGLEIAKDFELLYQNRANCYVKQGRYEEALKDAEAAIFLTQEKCAKPFFHQAKALTGLDRFDEARASYQRMAACSDAAPGHADRCAAELDRLATARADEARALAEFNGANSGGGAAAAATTVDSLIYRLARGDQPLVYYAAGMRCLAAAVDAAADSDAVDKDDATAGAGGGGSARALFRARSGFSLLGKQPVVVAALDTPLAKMSGEQLDLLTAALTLSAAVADGDAENCHRLLQLPALVARSTEAIVVASVPAATADAHAAVRLAATRALSRVCQLACDRFCGGGSDVAGQLLASLLGHVRRLPAREAASAARLVDRLADCQRLRERLQRGGSGGNAAAIVAAAESLVAAGAADSLAAFVQAVDAVRRLCAACPPVRLAAASRRTFLTACETALARYAPAADATSAATATAAIVDTSDELQQSAAASVAGLLTCAVLEPTPAVSARSVAIASLAVGLAVGVAASPSARQFALATLATLTTRHADVADRLGGDPAVLGLLARVLDSPGHPAAASALRVLAAAVRVNADARRTVGDDARWLERLLELMHGGADGADASADCLLGNAALCLGHCAEDSAAAELLSRSDIVRLLLCRMRDCRDREAKANCAILCGKLAQAHHGHRQRLRELDGINILNSVLVANNIRL